MTKIAVFGEADQRTMDQIERCAERAPYAVLCADNHLGYSQPIGGAVAYDGYVSPSGVGYDIGCGNKAVKTSLLADEIEVAPIMDEIVRRISFGMGRSALTQTDHDVLDEIDGYEYDPIRKLGQKARAQLGTVGGGNHYVDLFKDSRGYVWVGVHFGSRGFGHKIANGFLALGQGLDFGEKASEGSMDAPPTLLATDTDLGQAYIDAMTLAGNYAYAGRDIVTDTVLDILGAPAEYEVHNHHNYAWLEPHFGQDLWVVRKGCTPAWPGQEGFVGGSMGDISVILVGNESRRSADALYSTVHGAGRQMSRNEARGKVRRRKRYACMDRDCERVFQIDGISAHRAAPKTGICPDHPDARIKKVWVEEQKTEGKIDWGAVTASLVERGIVLRGGAADEAPGAYKRLPEVLEAQGETISLVETLEPIGVAMAGPDIQRDD